MLFVVVDMPIYQSRGVILHFDVGAICVVRSVCCKFTVLVVVWNCCITVHIIWRRVWCIGTGAKFAYQFLNAQRDVLVSLFR